MSSCGFSIHDIRFRRTRDDECAIVVHGQTVGTVMRRPDIANPDGGFFYAVHLMDDFRGPRLVDHRHEVRSAAAVMIVEHDLAPWIPPPVHPSFQDRLPA